MRIIGKGLFALLIIALSSGATWAEVTASVDRDRVALGDTLRLTITATENEGTNNTDLRPLLADFEILKRSSSNSTSFQNGRRTHTKQILLDITPRRQGTLRIPPMRVGRANTNLLLVAVGPPANSKTGGETVLFEAEVDRDSVYVQGQLILTLRIKQAVNLDNRAISEFQLDNAFVKPLEQQSFQRTINGHSWLVHEIRYAIFPEQSGTLNIPSQTFSAQESKPRRSFFDLGGGGRSLRRHSEPLTIQVSPRPTEFPATAWLPARSISIEESWSSPPEQLRAGDSATRTITIKGEGLQGAQLPPTMFPAVEGLKYYPDQPVISDVETGKGLLGSRQDSAALVPTRAGTVTIPELRLPWWDTEKRELRYAVLPQREISIIAADETMASIPPPLVEQSINTDAIQIAADAAPGANTVWWKAISGVTSLGWLLTLAYLAWSRQGGLGPASEAVENPSEREAFKRLLAACTGNKPAQARQALIEWAGSLHPEEAILSLTQAAQALGDVELSGELSRLDAALYSTSDSDWQGDALVRHIRVIRKRNAQSATGKTKQLTLYPA